MKIKYLITSGVWGLGRKKASVKKSDGMKRAERGILECGDRRRFAFPAGVWEIIPASCVQ
jgi:hypothetical protein